MIKDLSGAGAAPALEMMFRFAGQRQRLIAHNIANIDTPRFQQKDVSPKDFQELLGEAIDERRARTGGFRGELRMGRSDEIEFGPAQMMRFDPRTSSGNVLFHDRNNRDLERLMQDLVENAGVYRVASELLKKHTDRIGAAIGERVI